MDSCNRTAECCTEPGCLEEDREIASMAVSFVVSGARKGTVHLCSSIAELLKENRRLQRVVEAQKAQIRFLRNMSSAARSISVQASTSSSCSTPSLSIMQDTGISSSCSSGRGSLSPGVSVPGLPPLSATPHEVLIDHWKLATVHPHLEPNDQGYSALQVPLVYQYPRIPRRRLHPDSPRLPRRDTNTQNSASSSDFISRAEVSELEKNPREEVSLNKDIQTLHKKHKEKTTHGVRKEDTRLEEEFSNLGLKQRCPPTGTNSSMYHGTEGVDTGLNRHQCHTRAKQRLKLNDRVMLDTKQKGLVRYIGHVEDTDSGELFVGVELDSACGENDGTFNGTRYFRCKANYGIFTTMSHIKKLSKPRSPRASQVRAADSSDSDGRVSSARKAGSRLQRTTSQMKVTAQVHCPEPS